MKKFNGYCLVILFAAIVLAGCQFIWWKQWFNQLEKTITNGINQSELQARYREVSDELGNHL